MPFKRNVFPDCVSGGIVKLTAPSIVGASTVPPRTSLSEGNHLICTIPISFGKAVLGGTVEAPTIDGAVNLTIPPETQSGKTFRLKGKGIKSYRENFFGDLYCTVQVETPINLTQEQKDILRDFDHSIDSSKTDHRPNKKSWTDSVSDFFKRISE